MAALNGTSFQDNFTASRLEKRQSPTVETERNSIALPAPFSLSPFIAFQVYRLSSNVLRVRGRARGNFPGPGLSLCGLFYSPTNTMTLLGRMMNPPVVGISLPLTRSSQVSAVRYQQAEGGSSGRRTYRSSHQALEAT